jgi:ornithine cyclodeaminase/alanine dehydrogenase-like protein (mu-crystallin family)
MDSAEVTLRRTAAATALAARYLARSTARSAWICGCGEQARAHLQALRALFPIERCNAWDIDPSRARRFAEESRAPGLLVEAVDRLPAVIEADIVVTCTPSATPFLRASMIRPGTFIAAVGADSPHKSEIEPALMATATVVADVVDQCAAMGELRHAMAAGLSRSHVHAELGDLVSGMRQGRTFDDEITLFDSTGTALEDVASAAIIYERALTRPARIASIRLSEAG